MKAAQRNKKLGSHGTHRGREFRAYPSLMGRWRREKARRRSEGVTAKAGRVLADVMRGAVS